VTTAPDESAPDAPASTTAEVAPERLRANRDFQVVLTGQAVSAFGDAISLTAMPLLVLFLTGSGALMGIVGALQLLPDLVLGLPAGALADRWDRRRMMMWADAGRAILTALIPISFWLGLPTMVVILIVTLPINTLRLFSDAGFTSAVPGLVGRQNLARANGYMEATLSGSFIIGPALAGILVATIGAASTLAIDAATFAFSAVSLTLVRRRLRADRPREMPRILDDIKEGVRFVVAHPTLRSIIGYWAALTIGTAALLPALSYYITIDRRLGVELFGFVGSTWSVGYLLGSLLVGRLGQERIGPQMIVSSLVIAAALLVIAASDAPIVYLLAGSFIGAALSVILISYLTLRATLTPDELLGRVGSTARTVTLGLQPLGLLVTGALIDIADAATALVVMAALVASASLLFGASRTFREAGRTQVAEETAVPP
jgi:MFS family permease